MRTFCFVVAVGLLASFAPLTRSAHANDAQRAKELFQEGTRFFDLGQFDKAIDSWQSGYREKPDPVFLYNIAQAYRLAGDLSKAIFFYRGFLRNSPKAHNRPEVEQRIAALQKQLADQEQAKLSGRPAPPDGGREAQPGPRSASPAGPPPSTPPSTPAAGAPAAPPPPAGGSQPPTPPAPPDTQPAAGPTSTSASAPGEAPGVPTPATTPPASAPESALRPLDVGVGIGVDGWSSGVQGKVDPSFALMLTAGYALGHNPNAAVRFRIGGSFGYTLLTEVASKETFLSLLVVPTLLIRAGARVGFFGELGFGVLSVSGLKLGSALLAKNAAGVNGKAQSLLEVRPALGVQIQATPGLGFFATVADAYSPLKKGFYQPIARTELLFGLSLRR